MKPNDRCDYDNYDHQYPKDHHTLPFGVEALNPVDLNSSGAATILVASVKVQPAIAGDSDSGDATGGGSGATSPP